MEKTRRKRIILIGKSGAGKTTLCQAINQEDLRYHKTQTVQIFNQTMIDTPGEYLERRCLWGALSVTAADADLLVLVQDATEGGTMFPSGYVSMYGKPAVGVVTKCDLAGEAEICRAKRYLVMAGAQKLFLTSSLEGSGIEILTDELALWTE